MPELPAILGGNPVRPQGPPLWPVQDPGIAEVFRQLYVSGEWGRYHGVYINQLEHALQQKFATEHVHLCSSGTAAIELALRAAGVSTGDEVILCAYDFKANFTNILNLGALPVLVDVELDSWMINLKQILSVISSSTKAIILTHMHSELVDVHSIIKLCQERNIVVIEDCCQVPGAMLNDRRCGTLGDISVFSFGGSKLLTAGRGGAVLTRNPQFMQRIVLYQQRGNLAYPMSEMQAAVILPQLHKLDDQNHQRFQFVSRLTCLLNEFPGLQAHNPVPGSSYYKIGFKYQPEAWEGLTREEWIKAMQAEGMGVDLPFRSLHLIHSQKRFRAIHNLSQARKIDQTLILWHHPVFLGGTAELLEINAALTVIRNFAGNIKNEMQ